MAENIDRREFLRGGAAGMFAAAALGSGTADLSAQEQEVRPVNLAVIGTGGRGTSLLKRMLNIPGVRISALCDIKEQNLNRAIRIVKKRIDMTPEGYAQGPYDYRRMLERDDLEGVLVTTPAPLHAEMAIDVMNAGKHVASEVPGAYTVQQCRDLVKTKERTGKRYMLCENYIYTRERMMVWNMVRKGVFGDPFYAECSYIHDCRHLRFNSDGSLTWRGELKKKMFGNLYPTHALGPVSKWLGIHRGDRMVSLVSMMSKPASLHAYTEKRFGPESKQAKINFVCGDHNVTLIKTARDRMISLFYDSDSPRPMSNFYLIQGTEGVYDSRSGIYIDGKSPKHRWEKTGKYYSGYEHLRWRKYGEVARKTGHGGGDYFVVSDFVDMVRHDREPLIDVYDSAAWSSIVELSAESIRKGNDSVAIPDFTGGKWENTG